ncbi:MAG: hypothetical protein A3A85_05575 [Deltaproteobacteria bacterium RIFCSPLOWO2_01_FULL_42_9]|nr:MAG: hypothetical protein A3A85_05575 [Deltaproteobacteria bacterium RIFCSPLOWO2_01_FULL_42_9]
MTPSDKLQNAYVSKSLFLRGLQCYKSLCLDRRRPELRDESLYAREELFERGKEVEAYAQRLFPNGVFIPFEEISLSEQITQTIGEIKKRTPTLYQPAFSYNNVFVKVDILNKGKKGFGIYEVKSATEIKDIYIDDVAVQYYVLKGTGLPVSNANLVYINNQYVRDGEMEVDKLFIIENITEAIEERQGFIEEEIKSMREVLKEDNIPDIDIGRHCHDPYDCDFIGFCWQHIHEASVFELKGRGANGYELYKQGIIHLKDVPSELLSDKQTIQVEGALEKKDFINHKAVKEFLDSLWYPLCFLDFETFYIPIPPFDGTRPYQQIPYQYSLYCKDNENSELRHYEYLAETGIDPRKELIEKLLKEIQENACVVVYNKSFEIGVLKSLGGWFPEYKEKIDNIINNIIDLMSPFQRKDIYFYQMRGSYSIKAALPLLVPELSYENLEIKNGEMAMNAYFTMSKSQDPLEIEKIRKALLEYCKLDTFGMVKMVERMREF